MCWGNEDRVGYFVWVGNVGEHKHNCVALNVWVGENESSCVSSGIIEQRADNTFNLSIC